MRIKWGMRCYWKLRVNALRFSEPKVLGKVSLLLHTASTAREALLGLSAWQTPTVPPRFSAVPLEAPSAPSWLVSQVGISKAHGPFLSLSPNTRVLRLILSVLETPVPLRWAPQGQQLSLLILNFQQLAQWPRKNKYSTLWNKMYESLASLLRCNRQCQNIYFS